MVLCKACDEYLELLSNDGHHDRDGYDVKVNVNWLHSVKPIATI